MCVISKVHVSIRELQIISVSVQLDSIFHRSTTFEEKDINQPTKGLRPSLTRGSALNPHRPPPPKIYGDVPGIDNSLQIS